MNQYYVKIDGIETTITYSYKELKEMGVLEYDKILVRETNEKNWHSVKHYNFPEKPFGFKVNEQGLIVSENESCSNYIIDEFGQIVKVSTSDTLQAPSSTKSDMPKPFSSSTNSFSPKKGLYTGIVSLCSAYFVSVDIFQTILVIAGCCLLLFSLMFWLEK